MDLYLLQISVAWCRCDLRVNDVPVFEDDGSDRGRIDLERPVTHLLWSGDNALSITLSPIPVIEPASVVLLDDARVECEIVLIRRREGERGGARLAAMQFVGAGLRLGDPGASVRVGEGVVAHVLRATPESLLAWSQVRLADAFPRWSWTSGLVMPSTAETRDAVMAAYVQLREAADRRDSPFVRAALAENTREVQLGFDCDETEARSILGVEDLVGDPQTVALPVPSDARLDVVGYGRLARLLDARGNSALCFHEKGRGLMTYVDLFLANLPGRGLVAVR